MIAYLNNLGLLYFVIIFPNPPTFLNRLEWSAIYFLH